MDKLEKIMDLEAARVLIIEGQNLITKGIEKLESVVGKLPERVDIQIELYNLLSKVTSQQSKLGDK